MNSHKATPMLRQYLELKDQHPDAILFYRMGDFYEMFFEDAKIAAKELEITLTSRNKKDPDPIPMAGVPHHAMDNYLARLIQKGYKVAVCDQVEDPAQAKGIVKREVTRVVTPGMFTDNRFLDEKANLFVAALARAGKSVGLARMDLSTGDFFCTQSTDMAALADELARVSPGEVVFPGAFEENQKYAALVAAAHNTPHSFLTDEPFAPPRARETLCGHFKTQSLEGFGVEGMDAAVAAAGGLLTYVSEAQKQSLGHVKKIRPYHLGAFLWIDQSSARNLELLESLIEKSRQGTLLWVLDHTATSMGGRLLRRWLRYPLKDEEAINQRLDAVEQAVEQAPRRARIRALLDGVHDLERLTSRLSLGHANARDLVALKNSLQKIPDLWEELSEFDSALFNGPALADDLSDVALAIDQAISDEAPLSLKDGGIIHPGFNAELDELVRLSTDAKGAIAAMEATEKQSTGINSIKVKYNKVFGYFIEVPKSQVASIPDHYVRKQTLVNAERYITDELKKFETRVLGAQERSTALEYEIFCQVRDQVLAQDSRIALAAEHLAQCDALLNLAEVAEKNAYCRPAITDDGQVRITDGRHPVVEKMLPARSYVENSIHLDNQANQVLIITGPNMAGKSTVLRQAALTVVMAQMGSFVAAREASVGLVDKIFTRVGALDNLSAGQSTFLVEMNETANILNNATPKSLVILDEIGRGTSTFDGLSIAWAVAEYLHDLSGLGTKTLFATHYHELCDLAQTHPRVKNFHISVKEWNDEIIFLHTLEEGGTNKSHGIAVARLAGVPRSVVERAKQVLSTIEESDEARMRNSPEAKKKRLREPAVQLSLFATPGEQVAQALEKLNPDSMTPLEALNTLSMLQEKLGIKKPSNS